MHARFFQCSGARPTRAVRKQFEASEAGAKGPSPKQGDASATNQLIGRHRQRLSDRKVSPNRLICRRPPGEMSPNRTICRRKRGLFENQWHCRPEPAPPHLQYPAQLGVACQQVVYANDARHGRQAPAVRKTGPEVHQPASLETRLSTSRNITIPEHTPQRRSPCRGLSAEQGNG